MYKYKCNILFYFTYPLPFVKTNLDNAAPVSRNSTQVSELQTSRALRIVCFSYSPFYDSKLTVSYRKNSFK